MTDFKVGDVVTCGDTSDNLYRPCKLQLGKQYTVTKIIPKGHYAEGEVYLNNDNRFSWKPSHFKKLVEAFTKAMLKPGMRVVLRNGDRHVVGTSGLLNNDGAPARMLWYYSEAGLRELGVNPASLDIMEVWSGPELAIDFFDISKMGALLFKRAEKTEEELKKEAQLKDIAELEARLAELKAKINT